MRLSVHTADMTCSMFVDIVLSMTTGSRQQDKGDAADKTQYLVHGHPLLLLNFL